MSALPNDEKLILIARLKEGIQLRILAKSFRISIESVRRKEKKAVQKLKSCLEGKDWSVEDIYE